MQVVIDVNDELIEYFASHNWTNDSGWCSHSSQLLNAFRNGTPLPRGHGDLIDRSDLTPDSDYDDGDFLAVSMTQIKEAHTVLRADTEESED